MNEALRRLEIPESAITTPADDHTLINPIVALLEDPRILGRVRSHFFPRWVAKTNPYVPYNQRPLYIVRCVTREEADLAWYARPPSVRVRVDIIPTWEGAERRWSIPQLDNAQLDLQLNEASRRLTLAGALMDDEWAGLRSLAELRSRPGVPLQSPDATVVSRLRGAGLAKMRAGQLSCTRLGLYVLATIEQATGVNLTDPQITD